MKKGLFHFKTTKGFTLIELMMVISVIGVMSTVVISSLGSARKQASNSRVRQQVRQIINALTLARDDSPTGQFPGVSAPGVQAWRCLKASGTCWGTALLAPAFSGDPVVTTALQNYMPNVPTPPAPPFISGTYLFNAYLYLPNYTGGALNGPGTYIVWAQDGSFSDCKGTYAGNLIPGDNLYYCYEKVAPL